MSSKNERKVESWKASALFLIGHSIHAIANGGADLTPNQIATVIGSAGLAAVRSSDKRVRALAEIEAAAPATGLRSFVEREAVRAAIAAVCAIGQPNGLAGYQALRDQMVKERMFQATLPSLLDHARESLRVSKEPLPEAFNIIVSDRKSTVQRNVVGCPLEWLLHRGKLPQWAYDAAIHLREDWENASIGPVKGFDPSRDIVDTSTSTIGISGGRLDALARIGEVMTALSLVETSGSRHGQEMVRKAVWRYAVEMDGARTWVGRHREPIIPILLNGLEHVAYVYGIAPTGAVSHRLDMLARSNGGRLRPRVRELT